MIVAAVPVKDLANAKQRLTALLTPRERALLARAMLTDVLRALRLSAAAEAWVITRDAEVEAIAREHAVRVIREDDNRGHTAAVAFAQREAQGAGAEVFLTIPGDVPGVTPREIDALVEAARQIVPVAVFTASRSGLGTNGVALAPAGAMPLTFGEPSFANHLAAARARNLATVVLPLPGLALDIDTPDDLDALLATSAQTESRRLVSSWRLDARAGRTALTRS